MAQLAKPGEPRFALSTVPNVDGAGAVFEIAQIGVGSTCLLPRFTSIRDDI